MDKLDWLLINAEKMGVIFILICLVLGSCYIAYRLYLQERECGAARLVDAQERAEINKELGTLSGKVAAMEHLHLEVLTAVSRGRE